MAPAISLANALAALLHAATPDTVAVDRDNIAIRRSCTLVFPATPVADADGNGVVHIEAPADGGAITVDLGGGTLTGGAGSPDAHTGIGIVVRGPRVTIRNGAVRGYKVGIRAEDCDGLVVEDIDTSGNYAQRLRSTPTAEFAGDWLYPHHNDEGQWIAQHGAGIAVRQAKGVVLRRITSHGTQNGIVLDRVTDSELYDNDCSFLSGWGIAMWRSSRNTICRNRLIYCIRGYSHGLYNRGQDSAGLLMFEQCCDNLVALNSITHGGDGVFGFAGREALGEAPCPSSAIDPGDPLAWHRGRGCNGNIFARNDLSFAAAHGLEMTFSSRNTVYGNILEGNAICGIWGGYARDGVITGNEFRANGGAGYGLERGGANLEHAQRVRLARNRFTDEPVSVHLWTDADEGLRSLPWARANGMGAADNSVANNAFTRVRTPVELRGARGTRLAGNTFTECGAKVAQQDCVGTTEMDAAEAAALDAQDGSIIADIDARLAVLPGSTNPTASRVGARGRADIVMGEFAPWNHRDAIMVPVAAKRGEAIPPGVARFRVLGIEPGALRGDLIAVDAAGAADSPALTAALAGEHPDGGTVIEVRRASRDNALPSAVGTARPFTLRVRGGESGPRLEARGTLVDARWDTRIAPLDVPGGPRLGDVPAVDDVRRRTAASDAVALLLSHLDHDRSRGGPRQLAPSAESAARLPESPDRFCLTASTTLECAAGPWRIVVESDDGVRVRLDGRTILERWDIHGPTTDVAEFDLPVDQRISLEIEYFQNAGAARLAVRLERPDGP